MTDFVKIDFSSLGDLKSKPQSETGQTGKATSLIVFVGEDLKPAAATLALLGDAAQLIERAGRVANFKGKPRTSMDILAPAGLGFDRLVVVGTEPDPASSNFVVLGGYVMGRISEGSSATVAFDLPGDPAGANAATYTPELVRTSTMPSTSSAMIASRTVGRDTLYCSARSRSEGKRSPIA